MIYVLIAGSYTPMVLTFFPPHAGRVFAVAIWIAAAVGILLKVCFFSVPRWVSTALYLVMGWSILFDPASLRSIPTGAMLLLVMGGVFYTVGAVIYALKKPNLFRSFGFHELFHVFVILGSCMHYLVVLFYVL